MRSVGPYPIGITQAGQLLERLDEKAGGLYARAERLRAMSRSADGMRRIEDLKRAVVLLSPDARPDSAREQAFKKIYDGLPRLQAAWRRRMDAETALLPPADIATILLGLAAADRSDPQSRAQVEEALAGVQTFRAQLDSLNRARLDSLKQEIGSYTGKSWIDEMAAYVDTLEGHLQPNEPTHQETEHRAGHRDRVKPERV
jgi:hypothetical protein